MIETSVFLATAGRSGSTIIMKALSLHPQIVARSLFPFETRTAQFFQVAFKQNVRTIQPVQYQNVTYTPCQGRDMDSVQWLSNHSWNEASPKEIVLPYYSFVKELERKNSATMFSEKLIGLALVEELLETYNNSKVIFLRRDPRDTFFSIKSFNAKRGFLSFGEENGSENMFTGLLSYYIDANSLLNKMDSRMATLLKYEEFMENRSESLAQLFRNLELDYSANTLEQIVHNLDSPSVSEKDHRTTLPNKPTVNRWQSEVDNATTEMFLKYQDKIEMIGY